MPEAVGATSGLGGCLGKLATCLALPRAFITDASSEVYLNDTARHQLRTRTFLMSWILPLKPLILVMDSPKTD